MYIHDRWIATLIAAVAGVQAIPRPLIDYRQHDAQQIGAPSATVRRTLASALAQRRLGDTPLLIAEVAALRALEQRLVGQDVFRLDPRFMVTLGERLRHFGARLALPQSRLARLATVARELASGRYTRHSNGILSALKDLFAA
jgi:hypothetical protein